MEPGGVADAARAGLRRKTKQLPSWLGYDEIGAGLLQRLAEQPEYYQARAERAILEAHADEIIAAATLGGRAPLDLVELSAGSSGSTELLVAAAARRQGAVTVLVSDGSAAALRGIERRLAALGPQVRMHRVVGPHERVMGLASALANLQVVVLVGRASGSRAGDEAKELLCAIRRSLRPGAALILGADLHKDPAVLLKAYDDARGLGATWSKNFLARLNRELGAHFELERFRHVALWNDDEARVELYLESTVAQAVAIDALGQTVSLGAGERILVELAAKYDNRRIERLLQASGFAPIRAFHDPERSFAVQVAHAQ